MVNKMNTILEKTEEATQMKGVAKKKRTSRRQKVRKITILISFLLFPVIIFYLSPYLPIRGGIEGVIVGSLIVFVVLFIGALFLGRAYCGYVCPAGGLQNICMNIENKKTKGKYWIKWLIWIPWITTVILMPILVAEEGITQIDFLYQTRENYGISLMGLPGYVIYYAILVIIVSLALLVGKRAFCHYGCWMAPFMIISRKISNFLRLPALRLKADKDKCIDCKRCDTVCPMSLPVNKLVKSGNMEHSECILCGNCVDNCPKNAISYVFSTPSKSKSK